MSALVRRSERGQGVLRVVLQGVQSGPRVTTAAPDRRGRAHSPGAGPQDIAAALHGPIELHCQASGAQLSRRKSKGLMFGSQATIDPASRVCSVCQIPFPQAPIRHLGIFLSADEGVAAAETFKAVLGSVVAAAAHWRQIRLSYLGRAHE